MHNIPAVANLIRERKTNRIVSVLQTGAKLGMITLDDFLLNLYRQGHITGELALERAHYPDEMRIKLMGAGQEAVTR